MKKPFFSKFLENQVKEKEVKGGNISGPLTYPPYPTNKWPSDGDDDLPGGGA